ncbi:MAG: tetratricopeptide repeat protein [Spirochaetes bacterium]|nr:tetratricopeptide repeat protein [Spirochaetota bacterium]
MRPFATAAALVAAAAIRVAAATIPVAAAAIPVAALFSSCGQDGILKRMFDIDERAANQAPPSTIEELKAGIAKYQKDADRVVDAKEHIGTYWHMLAVKFLDKKMYGESLEAARKALEYFPVNAGIFYVTGVSAGFVAKSSVASGAAGTTSRDGHYRIAEASLKRAVEIDDRHAGSLYALSVLYVFELDRPLEAEPYLLKYLSIRTEDVDAMFVLARVYYVSGRFKEAVALYDRVVSITKIEEKKRQAEENKKKALEAMYGGS